MIELKPGAHIHMMGICGTAMGGLAGMLQKMGYRVTGSDQNVYPPMSTQLQSLGIQIMQGYKKENLKERPDLVVVGNVMTRSHEEVQALLETDIPRTSLPEAIGELLIKDRKSIVLTGTHGKTTSTSLMAWVAEVCGKEPGFMVGGRPLNFDQTFRVPEKDWFVIEGDEYDSAFFQKVPKFVFYKPRHVVVTSIEFDHADIYNSVDQILGEFSKLMKLIPKDGSLVWHAEDQNISKIVSLCQAKEVLSYGIGVGDIQARNIRFQAEFCQFDVFVKGKLEDTLQFKVFGRPNILNGLGVWGTAFILGWPKEKIRQAFETFKGVKRRQEIIGTPNGITVIEDFAHHPTAVRLTLEAVRERFEGKTVFAAFEPRSATSARRVFQKEYAKAFSAADHTLIARPFIRPNIPENDRFSPNELIDDLRKAGCNAHVMDSTDSIVEYVKSASKPGDVVVLMSNGSFDGIYPKMLEALR